MIGARCFVVGAVLLMSGTLAAQAPAALQAPPAQQPLQTTFPLPTLKIGSRVGVPAKSGYDDGGRRDPFASLIAEKQAAVATATEPAEGRAKGLAGVAVVDVAVKGIMTSGQTWMAIVAGPDGAMYLAHANDRLHDGMIRRIDKDAVVILARVPDGTGKMVSREVRKGIRPQTGDGR